MSDFFLTTSEIDLGPVSRSLSFTGYTESAPLDWGIVQGVICRVDSMDLWGPAFDPVSGIHAALVGRVALEADEWEQADKLPYEGGLACRMIIDKWLSRKDQFTGWLNGAGLILVYSERDRQLCLVTDRMGIIPAFSGEAEDLFLCSHTDVLAEAMERAGMGLSLDHLTMAEFLATGQSVHPHTYFRGIRQLDPATHHIWDVADRPRLVSRSEYWRPAYLDDQAVKTNDSIHLELAEAFRKSVRLRTPARLGKTGVLLSGGADSRLILFGMKTPAEMECITIYDGPSDELETAKKLALLAGARHHLLFRDFEYYGQNAPETVKVSGGMWSVSDGHIIGFSENIQALGLDTLLSGCYADYMFKGLSFNREKTRFLGRKVPVYRLAPCNYTWYRRRFSLSDKWAHEVDVRLRERFPDMKVGEFHHNQLNFEDRRLRPLSREADYSMRAGMYRTLPFDWIFGDNGVLDVYGRLTIEDKINGVVFEKAVASVVGKKGKKIPNNNYYKTPLGAGTLSRSLHFTKGRFFSDLKQTLRTGKEDEGVTQRRTWPVFKFYLSRSKVLPEMWSAPQPIVRELLTDILGYDPMEFSVKQWALRRPPLFMRILTVRLWLSQRDFM